MNHELTVINDICWISVSCNSLGILIALYKLKLIMSSKTNKTFTKTSVWILIQLIVGMTGCILMALVAIYHKEITDVIGEKAYSILKDVLIFTINIQPEWTTIS